MTVGIDVWLSLGFMADSAHEGAWMCGFLLLVKLHTCIKGHMTAGGWREES